MTLFPAVFAQFKPRLLNRQLHFLGRSVLSKEDHKRIVRQWVNRDGLLSHIKPFNIDRSQAYLNVLLLVTHLARLTGEVAEKICIDELENPYFWTKQKRPHPAPKIDIIISDLANAISKIMYPPQPIKSL